MKYKKILIILCAVLFFLAALTSYLNRIIFPHLIKRIAIERIEETLKRKVEIGSIHFNWVRGFVINKIKIYEKGSPETIFAQADQVNFGIIFFPGVKHCRITIPFINVSSPSVHLIRTGDDVWNFSDMYTSPPAARADHAKAEKAPAFEIAWGGISITDGKFLVDDESTSRRWSEFFDNINLKLSLSYKGISYDFTADIPSKKGSVGATVYYQPITQSTQAQIHLKNIDTASYLSLINIPDVHLESGIIEGIDLNIDRTQDKTSAQGDVIIDDLDITSHDQTFKGNIAIHDLDAQYQNGDMTAKGQMALSNMQTRVPGLSAGGSVQTRVGIFELSKEGLTFIGSLHAQNIFMDLKDRQIKVGTVILDNIKIAKDINGLQSVGSITTKDLSVAWPGQKLQGDISLNAVTMRMKSENDIVLTGTLQADHFSTSMNDKDLSSRHILLADTQLEITDKKNIQLNGKLSLDDMLLQMGDKFALSGSVQTEKFLLNVEDGIIKASTTLNSSDGKLVLNGYKTIKADPQLELTLQMPLNSPQEAVYKGSITLSDASIQGFIPFQNFDNVALDADFKNDVATINALNVNILNTSVSINGSVKHFKNPVLNITAEADDFNLAQIGDFAPKLTGPLGLNFEGSSTVKVKYDGLVSKPMSADILVVASVKNASVSSSKFPQQVKNIIGILEATPHSLKWRDTTAVYQGQKYTLSGSLVNFKHPAILATLDGPSMHLNADLLKKNDIVTINALTGKYLNAAFDSRGTITLNEGHGPVLNITSHASLLLEDLVKELPALQKKSFEPLDPSGMVSISAEVKGTALDWKNYQLNALVSSPDVRLKGYHLTDMKIAIKQDEGKIKDLTFDGKLYDGSVHAVGSMDLLKKDMPYDLALNIDSTDLHKLKMDSPLKLDTINGKFFLTTLAHGTIADFKNNLKATGSLAIRDGYLGEFNLFKGLLSVLNDTLGLGQEMITDVAGNFSIDDQKIRTDDLRLKGPTIVLLSKGWVNFDQLCDLHVTVDLSSGVAPTIANGVLNTLNIHIYDKISNPKFKNKISMPQVINSLIKKLWQ